jgi:hypothetical protein
VLASTCKQCPLFRDCVPAGIEHPIWHLPRWVFRCELARSIGRRPTARAAEMECVRLKWSACG